MYRHPEAILQIDPSFPPLYGDVITIPANTYFYRGYSTQYPIISSRPAYFGDISTAQSYSTAPNTKLGAFKTIVDINVLDYRFMKVILKQLFEVITKDTNLTTEDTEIIRSVTMSFGLCSLENQIRLLNNYPLEYLNHHDGFQKLIDSFKGPSLIEKPGIRVGETTNDSVTMGFLQGLFQNRTIHGFISPRLETVFHTEKSGGYLPAEMIVFNPKWCRIEQVPFPNSSLPVFSIYNLLIRNKPLVSIFIKDTVKTEFFMKGGSKESTLHILDDIDQNIKKKTKNIVNNYNKGLRVGQKWSRNNDTYIAYHLPPSPHIKVDIMNRYDGTRTPLEINS
jgi:hypothetical protein